mgnify:CR=1 FL=1
MIDVHDLRFGYKRKGVPLFDGLHLEIAPGTITGILGKNGAGKTTFLRLVSGLLFPQGGSVQIDGIDSCSRPVKLLESMFYVQEEYILPDVSIERYLMMYSGFYPNWSDDKFEQIRQAFELPLRKRLKELSFGQRKKFLIAFALSTGSKLLILDEPTNGLDIPSKTVFRKVVSSSLSEDQSLLISTHQVKDVENLLDRIVVVEGGRVIFNEELFAVASKFRFDFRPGSALPEKYLYAEPVPGGHVVMSANADPQTQTEVDIEILFNAIISKSI